MGACALGPLVLLDGEYHGHMTGARLSRLLACARRDQGAGVTGARLAGPAALARHREALLGGRDAEPARRSRCAPAPAAAPAARSRWWTRSAARCGRAAPQAELEVRATGCLGYCQGSPLLVVQPEGTVYRNVGVADVADVVASTRRGDVVERLLCTDPASGRPCRTRAGDRLLPRPAARAAARQRRCSTPPPSTTTSPSAGTRRWSAPWRWAPRPSWRRSSARACAGAAAPASRPGASGRRAAGPRATSSTWSATPTRATPARSWTTRCSRATRTACSRA